MLDRLIRFSVNNKFLIFLFILAWVGGGLYALRGLTIDAMPDITNNQVQIVTSAPALVAQEVEQFITFPVEMAMANIQHVEDIRSISRYGLSVVTVVFDEDMPVLDARQLVGQQLQQAREDIPPGYGNPELMPITTGLGEIYQYVLRVEPGYEDRYGPMELRTLHDWVVKRQLNGIPGIVEVSSFGGLLKQYVVELQPERLSSMGVSLAQVHQALLENNANTGSSYLQNGPYAYYVRADGLMRSIADIENTVVERRGSKPILVKDVATVALGSPPRFGAMTQDGRGEAVGGITLMLKGGNASEVIGRVKERVEQVRATLPEGVVLQPYLDRDELVSRVIRTVSVNLAEGGLIVIFVLVLLLGNLRAGIVVALVIPLSLLFAFGMMYLTGTVASVMSLGAIDFGLIVDGSVIIVEHILHQLHKRQGDGRLSQAEMDEEIRASTSRIKTSATFGAMIILLVYLPILALEGVEGKMFVPMAKTVAFAIVGALILSFTFVPAASSLLLSKEVSHRRSLADRIMEVLLRLYMPAIRWALDAKAVVVGLMLLLFGLSLWQFGRLGAVFIPTLDEGDLAMQMTVSPGSSLDQSIASSSQAEQVLLANFPEVVTVVSKIGTAEVPTDPMAIEDADIMIVLKPRDQWVSASSREELVGKMKQALEVVVGASFEFTQPIQLRFNELLTGAKADVVVKIYGEDLATLFDLATQAGRLIEGIPGAADVKVDQLEGLPQLVVRFDREQLARYGVSLEQANQLVRASIAGEPSGLVFEGERRFDLVLRLGNPRGLQGLEFFGSLRLPSASGELVPLSELADIQLIDGPMQILRDHTKRYASIGINVRDRDVQSLVFEIQEVLGGALELPTGYTLRYGGQFENLNSALARLQVVVPLALAMIYLMLYFAFGSWSQALLIFVTIPLSVLGGIAALWLRGMPFSISAGVGFIALFGVAVLDGIVLINYFNQLKREGWTDLRERILEGTRNRLRPVVVTAAVATLGFFPMAFSSSSGAEVQQPLATVVIGGLVGATFLTMVVLPVVYAYMESAGPRRRRPGGAALLALALLVPTAGQAQDTLSLDQMRARLAEQSPALRAADSRAQAAQARAQGAFRQSELSAQWQRGQMNSLAQDNQINLAQAFAPWQSAADRAFWQSQGQWEQAQGQRAGQELEAQLEAAYRGWMLDRARVEVLEAWLADLDSGARVARTRAEQGALSPGAALLLENRRDAMALRRDQARRQQQARLALLQALTASPAPLVPRADEPERAPAPEQAAAPPEQAWDATSLAGIAQAERDRAEAALRQARAQLAPSLEAGYFWQQIDRVPGHDGLWLGVSLPLAAWAGRPDQRAAQLELLAQEEQNRQQQTLFQGQRAAALAEWELCARSLDAYDQQLMPRAEQLRLNALQRFRAGDITHLEFVALVEEAHQTALERLDWLEAYNLAATRLKFSMF